MTKISQREMAKLFQRLATSYSAGIDIRKILVRESETGNARYRDQIHQISTDVAAGDSLAAALQQRAGYFPELAISVVHAGERGGRLEESFLRLADHYNNLVSFRKKLYAALAWPAFQAFVAIMTVGGLMAICDSMFSSLEKDKIDWLWMGSTSGNVIAYFVLVAFILSGLFLLCRGTAQGWFGSIPIKAVWNIPLIGKTLEALALSRFSWTLSVAENAGMNPVETAQLALRSTEIDYYRQHESTVERLLQAGNRFYPTFKSTGAFPEDLLIRVDNGETAGSLAESMDQASHEYQSQANLNLKLLGTVGFVCMLIFVGLLVGAILIFSVQQYVNLLNDMAGP